MKPAESFIGQPIRSLQTMLRVIHEDDPSHPAIIPDGIYGPENMAAISYFQRRHGLPVTGVTDQETWEAVTSHYNDALIRVDEAQPLYILLEPGEVIRRGEKHPHIFLVQGILQTLSDIYESVSLPDHNGILNDITSDSLASFQALMGLPMTGDLDKMTWKALALHYPQAASIATRVK
jgi:peptidoglycan hydrolase-like protein with peptidoglycan-binding domain